MEKIIIIGAGIIGCSIARELARYQCDIVVLEEKNDVACGTSKANSGIVHAGFDAKPNSNKAKFNVEGNKLFDKWAKELDFPFKRNGAFVLAFDKDNLPQIQDLYNKGIENGVDGLEILTGQQAREIEPNLAKNVEWALLAKTSGIVDPYGMTIACGENACQNGAKFIFNKKVIGLQTEEKVCVFCQDGTTYYADMIINCAGVNADDINNMTSQDKLTIVARKGEYMLLDKECGNIVSHTMFQLPTAMGKGILVAPTTHGNIILGPTAVDMDNKTNIATTVEGLNNVFDNACRTIPTLSKRSVITQFTGLRAHSVTNDFVIGLQGDKLYNVAGIESPGLTSAPAIAEYVSGELAQKLQLEKKQDYIATRQAIPQFSSMTDEEKEDIIKKNPLYGKVVCRCEVVTEGEIVEAIRRPIGATDLDGIKRRTRAGMGRCQAGFCTARIMEILARELNTDIKNITKNGKGSNIIMGGRNDD